MQPFRKFNTLEPPQDPAALILFPSGDDLNAEVVRLDGSGSIISFLEIERDNATSWPYTRRWIELAFHGREGLEELPLFLREYWIGHLREYVERFIDLEIQNADIQAPYWRILDILRSAERFDRSAYTISQCAHYAHPTLYDRIEPVDPDRFTPASVKLEGPLNLGSFLPRSKALLLRWHFGSDREERVIRIHRDPIEEEKVYMTSVTDLAGPKLYIVKFDDPRVVQQEIINYAEVQRRIRGPQRDRLLRSLYTIEQESGIFLRHDLVGVIVSRAADEDDRPDTASLRLNWESMAPNKIRRGLGNILTLLREVAIGGQGGEQAYFWEGSLRDLFNFAFRSLNGLKRTRTFSLISELRPFVIATAPPAHEADRWEQFLVRRVKFEAQRTRAVGAGGVQASGRAHVTFSVELESESGSRVSLRIPNLLNDDLWPVTVERRRLAANQPVWLSNELLNNINEPWESAQAKVGAFLHPRAGRALAGLDTLTLAGEDLPNPIALLSRLLEPGVDSLSTRSLAGAATLIHFDLKLDNIVRSRNGLALIDLASMAKGFVEIDFARLESQIVLECVISKIPNLAPIPSDIAELNPLFDFIRALSQNENDCPDPLLEKEFHLIRWLRRTRDKTRKAIEPSLTGTTFTNNHELPSLCMSFTYLAEFCSRGRREQSNHLELLAAVWCSAYFLKQANSLA